MTKEFLFALAALTVMPFMAQADSYGNSSAANDNDTVTTTTRSSSTYSSYSSDKTWMGMQGPYMTAFGGWNKTSNDSGIDFDDGWLAGVAVGGKMPWARGELEAAYRNNDLNGAGGGEAESWDVMANAYWDIETNSMITPYLGVGIGAANVDLDIAGIDDSWEFAYQGMAGLNFDVAPQWTLGAEYRYFATTEIDGVDYSNNALLGTVRYTF